MPDPAAVPPAEVAPADGASDGGASRVLASGNGGEDLGPRGRLPVWPAPPFATNGVATCDAAVARARARGSRSTLAQCLAVSGRAHLLVAEIPPARERFLECLALANRGGGALVAEAHVGLGWAALARGDYPPAATHLELALALAAGPPRPGYQAPVAVRVWLAELAARRGDHAAARRHYHSALAMVPPAAAPFPSTRALVGVARLDVDQGDLEAAGRRSAEALAVARRAADAYLVAPSLHALGTLALSRGESDKARSLLEQALAMAARWRDGMTEAAASGDLGRLARAEGDLASAAAAHRHALAIRARVGDRAGVAETLEALGRVGVAAGRPDPGVRLVAAGCALQQRLGHHSSSGDIEGYHADLAQARAALGPDRFDDEWAAGLHLGAEEAVAMAFCSRFGDPPDRRYAVTPAERRVVELAARGLTNREIARRLSIAPGTVQGHLRHVFAKLGLTRRAALVAEVQSWGGQAVTGP